MGIDLQSVIGQYGGQAIDALTKPLTDEINGKMAALAEQARARIATTKNIDPSMVTDLDVAECIAGIPTAQMSGQISEKVDYIGKCLRNGLIAGAVIVASVMVIDAIISNDK